MIIIFSNHGDASTSEVIDWILWNKGEIYRIDSMNDIHNLLLKYGGINLHQVSNTDLFQQIQSVWYRRRPNLWKEHELTDNASVNEAINSFYKSEQQGLFSSFCELLSDKTWLNHCSNSRINKIYQLISANKIGLMIPETEIINTKKEMIYFAKKKKKIIVKPIQDVYLIHFPHESYTQYTKILTLSSIKKLTNDFFPCLTQEYIDKNLEIRSFFINDKIYSMAICSSFDQQTCFDFRRYNRNYPNRTIPYKLPDSIEHKIIDLMSMLQLNSGSIDLILSQSGDFYFLEVNPVGQFGMVSAPCNYYLEKEIAEYLIKKE